MSYSFLKWDKVSNINNCTAEEYLANHPEVKESDEIALVSENGAVVYVLNTTHMREELGLAADVDAETVAQAHMAKIAEQNTAAATQAADQATKQTEMEQKIADITFALAVGGLI